MANFLSHAMLTLHRHPKIRKELASANRDGREFPEPDRLRGSIATASMGYTETKGPVVGSVAADTHISSLSRTSPNWSGYLPSLSE